MIEKTIPNFDESSLPAMLRHQADDVIAVGPYDIRRTPDFLKEQTAAHDRKQR
jgi:hypothetical protein